MTPAVPRYLSAAASDPGSIRDNNEDRVYADDARGFFMVIDGMGGHQAGEQAADIALERIRTRLERQTDSADQRLREAITLANNAIFDAARSREEWRGMACVLTAAVVENGQVTIGHVGDSRLYKIRRGRIEKITHDHSPVGEREDRGEINEAEAMRHPRRNEVYRDVGSAEHAPDDEDFIEVARIPFESDSALLLCSDGLSDILSSDAILRVVNENAGDRRAAVRALIAAANEDGKDNISAILVEGAEFAAIRPARKDTEDTGRLTSRGDAWYRRLAYFIGGLIVGALFLFGIQSMFPPPPLPHLPQSFVVSDDGTIAAALIKAQAGDTVLLPPGTFRELVELKPGVDLIAQKPHATILEGSIVANNIDRVRVEGLQIRAGTVGIDVHNSDIQIARCEIAGGHMAGVRFSGNSTGSLIATTIRDNPGAGIVIEDTAAPSIEHNTVAANGADPAALHPGLLIHTSGHPNVIGNYFFGNGAEAIWLPAADESIVQRNHFTPASKTDKRKPFRIIPPEVRP
jgi:serine/threonine protein phosphatase PrpC